jgi:hypothetical protein
VLALVEDHAARYHQCPETVRMSIPLARLQVWALAAADRRGDYVIRPDTLEQLDEVAAAGGVTAWLEKNRE